MGNVPTRNRRSHSPWRSIKLELGNYGAPGDRADFRLAWIELWVSQLVIVKVWGVESVPYQQQESGQTENHGEGDSRKAIIAEDVRELHKLGSAQELFRAMSGFSNFASSFSIISVRSGAVILYGWRLRYGGPGINGRVWPQVSMFTLCIVAGMAAVASAYPTAGGLYSWASQMGHRH